MGQTASNGQNNAKPLKSLATKIPPADHIPAIFANLPALARGCWPYMAANIPGPANYSPLYFETKAKENTNGIYKHNRTHGLFSTSFITKGTLLFPAADIRSAKLNDPMLDMELIVRASMSNEALYQALCHLGQTYYIRAVFRDKVNVRLVQTSDGFVGYQATQDIPAGAELFRAYGLSSWSTEFFPLITSHNVYGYMHYIYYCYSSQPDNPGQYEQQAILRILNTMTGSDCSKIVTLLPNLNQYDAISKDQEIYGLGDELATWYRVETKQAGLLETMEKVVDDFQSSNPERGDVTPENITMKDIEGLFESMLPFVQNTDPSQIGQLRKTIPSLVSSMIGGLTGNLTVPVSIGSTQDVPLPSPDPD